MLAELPDKDVVGKLFETIAPRFAERPGGYTRILRVGFRRGDSAEVAQVELVGSEYNPKAAEEKNAEKAAAPKTKSVGDRLQVRRARPPHARRGRGRLEGAGRRPDEGQGAEDDDAAESWRVVNRKSQDPNSQINKRPGRLEVAGPFLLGLGVGVWDLS